MLKTDKKTNEFLNYFLCIGKAWFFQVYFFSSFYCVITDSYSSSDFQVFALLPFDLKNSNF